MDFWDHLGEKTGYENGDNIMDLKWSNAINYGGKGGYDWSDYDGVYVIAKKFDGKLKAIYVGQGNILENMQRHEDKDEQNKCLRDFMQKRNKDTKIYHAKIINDGDRNNAEYTLFVYYGGKDLLCNENTPYGKSVYDLNFPFNKIELNY